jgi:hypothetical protein
LECRDLLRAGRAGCHYGFAALNLGLQAARNNFLNGNMAQQYRRPAAASPLAIKFTFAKSMS